MRVNIDWSKQHCGVHQAPFKEMCRLMPDLKGLMTTFPDSPTKFTWDVKVTMLMPGQWPCIPGWHTDAVPRIDGIQRFDLCKPELPMYLWISGAPLTQFKHGFATPQKWIRFNQLDEHRGMPADDFTWRCFIRATHQGIQKPKNGDFLRRHSQVYLDAGSFQW